MQSRIVLLSPLVAGLVLFRLAGCVILVADKGVAAKGTACISGENACCPRSSSLSEGGIGPNNAVSCEYVGTLFRRLERAVAMMTVAEALARAVQAHKAGQWQQAETLYRQVLQADPANVDALHRLGVLAYQARQ